jgi:hypothetical protein
MPLNYHGPLPAAFWPVLKHAWKYGGITLQSDYARSNALHLALAASMGWLSTIDPDGKSYRGQWRITTAGLTALQNKENFE